MSTMIAVEVVVVVVVAANSCQHDFSAGCVEGETILVLETIDE